MIVLTPTSAKVYSKPKSRSIQSSGPFAYWGIQVTLPLFVEYIEQLASGCKITYRVNTASQPPNSQTNLGPKYSFATNQISLEALPLQKSKYLPTKRFHKKSVSPIWNYLIPNASPQPSILPTQVVWSPIKMWQLLQSGTPSARMVLVHLDLRNSLASILLPNKQREAEDAVFTVTVQVAMSIVTVRSPMVFLFTIRVGRPRSATAHGCPPIPICYPWGGQIDLTNYTSVFTHQTYS